MEMVYGKYLPAGMVPIALYDADLPGKSSEMKVLNDRPINAETPAHLLDPSITPRELFFVRNNGIPPSKVDVENWTLTIEGESAREKKTYTLQELKSRFKEVTLKLTLECGGNGRSEFNPPAKGNQWSTGAVGCAEWTGVRLRDVLNDVGFKNDAVYVGYYGADIHLSGDPSKQSISRGVPMKKALEPESLIALQMNGEDLPELNGYPLRLVFGGYPASCSGKWLNRLVIRNKEHDGNKMGGQSYRVPCKPVAPGTKVADEDMCIIEDMPVKSIITYPKTGAMITQGQQLPIRGHAWTSAPRISQVEYSIDFGKSWNRCIVKAGDNRYAWQDFNASVTFPERGYYEVWAKATDDRGATQPIILPGWNPKGYLNNACHRIAVKVV
ncbi:MAG: sulfite oxidase [Saprospiraceae bacterium]|nr:sulfite oxidase [Saprospiraceae bacterium]